MIYSMQFVVKVSIVLLIAALALPMWASDQSDTTASRLVSGCAYVLSNDTTDRRIRKAYLVLDAQGRPAIYPAPRRNRQTHKANDLRTMSLDDVQQIWGSGTKIGDAYGFNFVGLIKGWTPVHVDLKFKDGACVSFRIIASYIPSDWLQPPEAFDEKIRDASGKLTLAPWVGIVEGPRDSPDCSVDPNRED